jgi:hypothetical protein
MLARRSPEVLARTDVTSKAGWTCATLESRLVRVRQASARHYEPLVQHVDQTPRFRVERQ